MCDKLREVGGLFAPPHPWEAPKMPILNRLRLKLDQEKNNILFNSIYSAVLSCNIY